MTFLKISFLKQLSLFLLLVLLCTFLPYTLAAGTGTSAQTTIPPGAPVFTENDLQIPGLNYTAEPSSVYLSPDICTYLSGTYTKGMSYAKAVLSGELAGASLLIIYFYDVQTANNPGVTDSFANLQNLVQGQLSPLQQNPQNYDVIDETISQNYSSVIWTVTGTVPDRSPYSSSGYMIMNGADPRYSGNLHYVIYITAYGLYFDTKTEVKQLMDTLQSHALQVINSKQSSSTTTTLLPIIFLPGVGGSELDIVSGTTSKQIWPTPFGTTIPQVIRNWWQLIKKVDMSALKMNSAGNGQDDPSVNVLASDILRSGLSNFYGRFISFLGTKGYVEGKNLLVFPYDFRLDNAAHLDELDHLIDQARTTTGSQKVVLIAHSMGGLIATAYVNSDTARASKVDSIITLGTPFWGSPKAYYTLTEGYNLGNAFVNLQQMKALSQNFPAVYELLPRMPFIVRANSGGSVSLYQAFGIIYKNAYSDAPCQFNQAVLNLAYAFNNLIGAPSSPIIPASVKLYTIIGCGTQTLSGYTLRTPTSDELARHMTVKINGIDVVLVPQFSDGDGTVQLWGAENSAATAKYYLRTASGDSAVHADLTKNLKAQAIVWSIIQGKPPSQDTFAYTPSNGGNAAGERIDMTVHSSVNLEILDQNGGMMGWNAPDGTIIEDLPQGTFIQQDGIQYASIQNSSIPYILFVNGTETGNFTMTISVTNTGTTTVFSYPNVPVLNGSVMQLLLNPTAVKASLPSLTVTTNGQTNEFSPEPSSTTGNSQTQTILGAPLMILLAIVVIVAALTVSIIALKRKGRRLKQAEIINTSKMQTSPSATQLSAGKTIQFCGNCGKRLPVQAHFCSECGQPTKRTEKT